MAETHGLQIQVEAEDGFFTEEEDMRVLLFQIIRELLYNIVRHAGVDQAQVALNRTEHHIHLQVRDEGVGFGWRDHDVLSPRHSEAERSAERDSARDAAGRAPARLHARAPRHRQTALLVLVMLPFWSNYLIRTYAWMVLLNREGLVNKGLITLGVTAEPLPLLYNEFAIVTGLVYNYLPVVVLAIYASISRLNPEVLEASEDLGASGFRTFRRVTLPLTLPGVAAGAVFVFVLSIGNFITPDLLGGGRLQMVGNVIYDQFLTARDWPFGATLSFLLIGVMMALLFSQALLVRRAQGEGAAVHA